MNNEETIIMQPKNNEEAQQPQEVETPKAESAKEEQKSNNGKKVAATVAAAAVGGIIGGAGTAAAASMYQDAQDGETETSVEEETPTSTAKPDPKPVEEPQINPEEVAVTVDGNGETDYTNNGGADPVAQSPQATPTSNEEGGGNDVQVLGVYEAQGENGQTMEAAILTDGQEVVAVVDVDGDGVADVLLADENHNQQIDEGEVYDVSSDHVQMSQYENAYLAQQQEQMQQEQETFAYNADSQQDYNNDAPDLSFA